MKDNGFILLSRSILESDVFASQKLLKIWIWCLCKANFKDKTVPLKVGKGERLVKVKRGSFIFGRYKAEEQLFIDGSTIYKLMQKLKDLEMIEIKSNNQYSIITICNYDYYQSVDNYQVTTKEQPSNNKVTTKEQPKNTTKNDNKDKNEKNVNNIYKFNFKKQFLDLGVNEEILKDWLQVRKEKKASNTKTAFTRFINQVNLSGLTVNECVQICAEKGWKGFEAEWLTNLNRNNGITKKSNGYATSDEELKAILSKHFD